MPNFDNRAFIRKAITESLALKCMFLLVNFTIKMPDEKANFRYCSVL